MSGYDVRVLTSDDQPAWRALRLEALETHPDAFLTTAAEQHARSVEQERAGLSHGNWRGVFHEDALIGLAALIPMSREVTRHRMEVGAVYVTAAHRGRGAARVLMLALEAEALDRGARQLELEVAAKNAAAVSFYERLGYQRIGLRPRAVWTQDGPADDALYVKFLDGGSY